MKIAEGSVILLLFFYLNSYGQTLTTDGLSINGGANQSTLPTGRGSIIDTLKTNGTGTLTWARPIKMVKMIDYLGGPLPLTSGVTYTTSGGTIKIDASGACYRSSVGTTVTQIQVSYNGGAYTGLFNLHMWVNTTGSATPSPRRSFVVTGIATGTTINLKVVDGGNCSTGTGEKFDVTLTEF